MTSYVESVISLWQLSCRQGPSGLSSAVKQNHNVVGSAWLPPAVRAHGYSVKVKKIEECPRYCRFAVIYLVFSGMKRIAVIYCTAWKLLTVYCVTWFVKLLLKWLNCIYVVRYCAPVALPLCIIASGACIAESTRYPEFYTVPPCLQVFTLAVTYRNKSSKSVYSP